MGRVSRAASYQHLRVEAIVAAWSRHTAPRQPPTRWRLLGCALELLAEGRDAVSSPEKPPQASTPAVLHRRGASWKDDVTATIRQDGLMELRLSLEGLNRSRQTKRSRVVFVGVGLCTRERLSVALPLDVIATLLSAVRLQRAVGARSVRLLIADEHARCGGRFEDAAVSAVAEATEDTLRRVVGSFELGAVEILRASQVHATPEYMEILEEVERRAPGAAAYFHREVADMEFFHRVCGGILKLGWGVSGPVQMRHQYDEVAFDQRFRAWVGDHVTCVYGKPGRVFDARRPRASPYVAIDPARRVCLSRGEDVRAKLGLARSRVGGDTWRGARRHLGAITRAFCAVVGPLSGDTEGRAQQLIDRVFADAQA